MIVTRYSTDGETMYVTGPGGLRIYDLAGRCVRRPVASLALPEVADDALGTIHLVDVSDPSMPALTLILPTLHVGLPDTVAIFDVRDLSRPPGEDLPGGQELLWVNGGHRELLPALSPSVRAQSWSDAGAQVGFYATTGTSWGVYQPPSKSFNGCLSVGSRGRHAERVPLSPIGE